MLIVILVSFMLTGAVSIYHFKTENEHYHEERLKRKQDQINAAIRYYLIQHDPADEEAVVSLFDNKICELSDIHHLPISLFGKEGNYLTSSNPELHEKGLIPNQLKQMVVDRLLNGQPDFITTTKVDTTILLNIFSPFQNGNGDIIGFVGLPYFEDNDRVEADMREFFSFLSTIYLFIFLLASLLGYFLSRYITDSITTIAKQLKEIRLTNKNKELPWKSEDEIGILVQEYNKMVSMLEENAVQLAKSERENAWKEMAQQVAHEIKNPITPMRLLAQQYEKRAAVVKPDEIKEFTQTLIHQIDTLSEIAEAFARFADLPEMKLEKVNLREIIDASTPLFPQVEFAVSEVGDSHIFGDRAQLLRVFQNLIKNAKQAVVPPQNPIIEIKIFNNQGLVYCTISDNGSGIPEGKFEKIFEPNFTTKTSGMGLGLSMVKNIILALKGKISVSNNPTGGACFTLAFPAA